MSYVSFLLLVILAGPQILFGEGFVVGTLVKTASGYTPIEQLTRGDSVICYDFESQCVERPVLQVVHTTSRHQVHIITARGEEMIVDQDHR